MADASAPAYLTLKSAAYMLAYRRSATLLELALFALVGTDAGAPVVLEATLLAVVGALLARWPWHLSVAKQSKNTIARIEDNVVLLRLLVNR